MGERFTTVPALKQGLQAYIDILIPVCNYKDTVFKRIMLIDGKLRFKQRSITLSYFPTILKEYIEFFIILGLMDRYQMLPLPSLQGQPLIIWGGIGNQGKKLEALLFITDNDSPGKSLCLP